jgi:hypothetical protein
VVAGVTHGEVKNLSLEFSAYLTKMRRCWLPA